MSDGPMLTAAIAKIATQAVGGWRMTLDIPESMREVVQALVGTENKVVYQVSFENMGEIEQAEKRKPGRPRQNEEAV